MAQKNIEKSGALELIRKVTEEVERIRPSKDEMLGEIKMMRFKVRSVSGNIFDLARSHFGFVESLWKMAKIEEIVAGAIDSLDDKEREILFRFLDNLEMSVQDKISAMIESLPYEEQQKARVLKVEIFRDGRKKKIDLN